MASRRQEEEVIDVDDETQDEGTVLLPVKRRKVKTKSLQRLLFLIVDRVQILKTFKKRKKSALTDIISSCNIYSIKGTQFAVMQEDSDETSVVSQCTA